MCVHIVKELACHVNNKMRKCTTKTRLECWSQGTKLFPVLVCLKTRNLNKAFFPPVSCFCQVFSNSNGKITDTYVLDCEAERGSYRWHRANE